jgi:hypothetical protein
MRFLCLAYGDEAGWSSLSEDEKQDALAHDAVIRDRGNLMSAVQSRVTSVRNQDGNLEVSETNTSKKKQLPLAGFSVIEAADLDEVIGLVSDTPCARARGVIEIYPFRDIV